MSDSIYEQEEIKRAFYNDKCDKNDYLIAAGCGAIAGVIDIFFVGSPKDSKLQVWTDNQVDKTVMAFAKKCEWSPREGQENNVASAIGFLERRFRVNYDQRHSQDVGNLFDMSTKNHHMKSLAHSPDIVGLFFSILNQFTSTSSFLHNGELITVKTDTFELEGNNFITKLFCGMVNWFGHIMSDVAGSSGASNRGSGVVIPFFEFFQLCNFGKFQVDENRNTLAKLASKVFQEGYDARFGLTMSIPVMLCELSIKLIWAIKRHFYYKRPIEECIPSKRHDELRVMLIVGHGVLCLMNGTKSFVKSKGNSLIFFLNLNIIAWFRLIYLVLKEVFIRVGFSSPIQKQIDAYIRINEALTEYLKELERIDVERYRKETEEYNQLVAMMDDINSEEELSVFLDKEYKRLGIELPYSGDFDEFMKDSSSRLVFN